MKVSTLKWSPKMTLGLKGNFPLTSDADMQVEATKQI